MNNIISSNIKVNAREQIFLDRERYQAVFMQRPWENGVSFSLFEVFPVIVGKSVNLWVWYLIATRKRQHFLELAVMCWRVKWVVEHQKQVLRGLYLRLGEKVEEPAHKQNFLCWNMYSANVGLPVVCWGSGNIAQTARPWSPWFCRVSGGPERRWQGEKVSASDRQGFRASVIPGVAPSGRFTYTHYIHLQQVQWGIHWNMLGCLMTSHTVMAHQHMGSDYRVLHSPLPAGVWKTGWHMSWLLEICNTMLPSEI